MDSSSLTLILLMFLIHSGLTQVKLTCDIEGRDTQWTYSWFNDGNPFYTYTPSTEISYSFRAVYRYSSGEYRCEAKRSDISDGVTLTVSVKAAVKVNPDQLVFRGETVTLTCDIQGGRGQWTYSWFRDGSRVSHTERDITVSDGEKYRCEAQRSDISDGVTLTVSEKPKVVLNVQPNPSQIFRGETVTLTCDVQGEGWRYRWWCVGGIFHTSKEIKITADRTQKCECRACRESRSGSDFCSEWSEVTLSVFDLPKPRVTVTPDRSVFAGETVNLKCEINSDHRDWRYEWNKDTNSVKLQTSERYTVNRDTLTIRGATESDQGQYWCRGQRDGRPNSSQSSSVSLSVYDLPISTVTVTPDRSVFTGETVNLTCEMESYSNWRYEWYKGSGSSVMLNDPQRYTVTKETLTIREVTKGDQGQYWCRGQRRGRPNASQSSSAVSLSVNEIPKAVLTVRPDERVFRGETVTLRCDIKWGGDTEWTYRWEIEGTNNRYKDTVSRTSTQELNISSVEDFHSGKYTCTGQMDTQSSQRSDAVTLTVSAEAQAVVRVSPQPWLTEGESATLICEVSGSSTGWRFSWFRDHDHLSDSSRGAGGSYTLSPAALQHTGVYTCRAERGRAAYSTRNSSSQPLWVTAVSASVSLLINPSRSQHFSSDSLSLSCEDQSNSAGWTVRRYTDKDTETCSKQTGSSCGIESLRTSDTGVYWCESESGEKRHPRNITVQDGEVILASSVDPVIEGETLTLHCLHRSTNPSILSADFYKDGSLVQNQTTGEMSITTVSKSHEGFYSCKTERGQSSRSWISVRASRSTQISVSKIISFLASVFRICWRQL